jgi:hypothetical protein
MGDEGGSASISPTGASLLDCFSLRPDKGARYG